MDVVVVKLVKGTKHFLMWLKQVFNKFSYVLLKQNWYMTVQWQQVLSLQACSMTLQVIYFKYITTEILQHIARSGILSFVYPISPLIFLWPTFCVLGHRYLLEAQDIPVFATVVTSVTKCRGSANAVLSCWLFSAAEWGQTLLHRHKKEPVHWQEHKSHLPRLHRETGLCWWLLTVTDFSVVASQMMQCCCSFPLLHSHFHFHNWVYSINQITRDGYGKLFLFVYFCF